MTTAFVAGATGYTGRHVVPALCERDIRTVAHVRPDSPSREARSRELRSSGAEIDVSPWELEPMAEMLHRLSPQLVFSLLGTTRKRGRQAARDRGSVETYETVDYGLTSLLIRAVVESGHRPRFVYLSSLGVREGTNNAYLQARYKAERELRESGLPYTIVRPSFISGSDRAESRPLERVGATVADGALAIAAALGARKLRDTYASRTGEEMAQALVRVALDPGSENRIIESGEL